MAIEYFYTKIDAKRFAERRRKQGFKVTINKANVNTVAKHKDGRLLLAPVDGYRVYSYRK